MIYCQYLEWVGIPLKIGGSWLVLRPWVSTSFNVLDAPLPVGRQFATASGPSIGTSTTLREIGQNAKSSTVSFFTKKTDNSLKAADKVRDSTRVTTIVNKTPDTKKLGDGLVGSKSINEWPSNVQEAYKGYDGVSWKGNFNGQASDTNAGRRFWNDKLQLPTKDINGSPIVYKEYDVNAKLPNLDRDGYRFVRGSDNSVYYTEDHYRSFVKLID